MSEMNSETEVRDGQRYWRSLGDWAGDPEFRKLAEAEFQSSPLRESREEGWARREFLKLMGASLAMSTVSCVRRPVQKIVPYNKQPEEVTLGVDNLYTSTWYDGADGMGLLIRTREGRPLKVEGNPQFPLNQHGVSVRGLAHILSLYDPDRFRNPKRNIQNMDKGRERSNRDVANVKWEAADEAVVAELKKGGVALLTGSLHSPTTRAVVSDFAQAFSAQHYIYDPISFEEIRQGQKDSYGTDLVPSYRMDKAKLIVSVDADFLGAFPMATSLQRQFSLGRKDPKGMNKLVAFDSQYSLTGANADIRVRIKPSAQLHAVLGLAYEVIVTKKATRYAGNESVARMLAPFSKAHEVLQVEREFMSKLAEELIQARGQSLILAGGLSAQSESGKDLQIAVNFLNSALENDGATVDSIRPLPGLRGSHAALEKLITDIEQGRVKTLIMHQVNPVYSSPLAERFVAALAKLPMVVSTADRNDETSKYADYVLPDTHPMENWGDAEFIEGLYALQQPTIRPLHDTRSFQLSLMTWAYLAEKGSKRLLDFETYYDYLRNYWKTEIYPKHGRGRSFDDFWDEALQKGYVGHAEARKGSSRNFRLEALSQIKAPATDKGHELVLYATKPHYDGTLANVAWLQELPDPVTKICWGNYAMVSMATAEKLKLKSGSVIEVTVGEKKAKLPVHIQPGLHDEVVAIPVGFGRMNAGGVGTGIGVNAFPLATYKDGQLVAAGQAIGVKKTGGHILLASSQDHHSMEGRKIVVEATLKEFLKDEAVNNHSHHVWSIWSGHQYNGYKWAMAVDLNTCTGCEACVVACQSENNIPVVGKKYVTEGREMHWLRIDRYYVGDPNQAETVFQPVMCQQCDNAPCETVCPVLATVHSDEGLNDMVYNRCVGTRYCSNNCPYKVRRFNWFNYAQKIDKPLHMALNPDVTVRSRGVMEKCTFCVHRIKAGRIKAKKEGRTLRDMEVQTACQQACPSDAIIFGNINDPESQVAKLAKEKRAYALLEEFGAAPTVRYLTKIRNNGQEKRFGAHEGGHA